LFYYVDAIERRSGLRADICGAARWAERKGSAQAQSKHKHTTPRASTGGYRQDVSKELERLASHQHHATAKKKRNF
jgi:hypothetical protein